MNYFKSGSLSRCCFEKQHFHDAMLRIVAGKACEESLQAKAIDANQQRNGRQADKHHREPLSFTRRCTAN